MWVLLKGKSSRTVGNIWLDWNCNTSQEKWPILLFYFHRRGWIWDLKPFTHMNCSLTSSSCRTAFSWAVFTCTWRLGFFKHDWDGGAWKRVKGDHWVGWFFVADIQQDDQYRLLLFSKFARSLYSRVLGVGEEKVVISVHECCAELPACIQTCI